MYKDVFDKEIAWLDEEIRIIEDMLKNEAAQSKEYARLYDKKIFAFNERARLYAWLDEAKSTATHHENDGITNKEAEECLTKTICDFLVINELYHVAMETVKQNIDRSISAMKEGNYETLGLLLNKMKESCDEKEKNKNE